MVSESQPDKATGVWRTPNEVKEVEKVTFNDDVRCPNN